MNENGRAQQPLSSAEAIVIDIRVNNCHAYIENMTATDFSKLADLIQGDSVPRWFRQQVDEKSVEILRILEQGESITLHGPQGEAVTIAPAAPGASTPA